MARIVILNDITTWNRIGMSRYAGPYVVASRLRAMGYQVQVVEWFTQHPDPLALIESVLTSDTIAVCLSTTFLTQDPYHDMSPDEINELVNAKGRAAIRSAQMASTMWFQEESECADWFRGLRRLLDRRCPSARVILGGARVGNLFMYKPERLAAILPCVDYGLIGAADDSVVNLFDDLKANRRPYGVEKGGITFIKPLMIRNICPSMKFDRADLIQPGESLPIELKRGCAFNCKFCHYEKRGSTMKDPSLLWDELMRNYDEFGTTSYTFSDDCFNDNRKNVESVCNTIANLPFKLEWVSYARADLAIKFPDTLSAMIQTGARGLFLGIETFNYEAGRACGKGVPPDKVKQFLIDTMARYGDQTLIQCSFISGLPHETDQSMQDTIDWLGEHRPMHLFGMSPLGLYEYHEDLDDTAIDYADYARNPQKYGFEEVRHHPDVYWKHGTMDLPRAKEWAEEATRRWFSGDHARPIFRSMWWYPAYRSLGMSHSEIMAGLSSPDGWSANANVRDRWSTFSSGYWNSLADSVDHG